MQACTPCDSSDIAYVCVMRGAERVTASLPADAPSASQYPKLGK